MADEAPTPPPSGPQTRAFAATIDDVSTTRRSVTAKINTAVVDRHRTVILPAGGDFRRFIQTPAVLWEHGQDPTRGRQAIGHCTSIKYRKAENDILAVTQFKSDEYSNRIFDDYAEGTLTSFSIDFLPDPQRSGAPTPDEVRANPDWAAAYCVYRTWELTGYSAVSYPGNPEALALAVERGLWVPDAVRRSLPAPKRQARHGRRRRRIGRLCDRDEGRPGPLRRRTRRHVVRDGRRPRLQPARDPGRGRARDGEPGAGRGHRRRTAARTGRPVLSHESPHLHG